MKKSYYWYQICPFCNEGRLLVFKNISAEKLYFHCEECERGYYDIQHLDVEHSFLTLLEDFESTAASFDDIQKGGWGHLPLEVAYI
jgi:hypothetical protein